MLIEFERSLQESVKSFILLVLKEYGFSYDKNLDYDLEDIYEEYKPEDGNVFLVHLDGAEIRGTIALERVDEEVCELKRFYVGAQYRSKGIGRNLHEKLLQYARRFNYKKIVLNTTDNMKRAISFYEKAGYELEPLNQSDSGVIYFSLDLSK